MLDTHLTDFNAPFMHFWHKDVDNARECHRILRLKISHLWAYAEATDRQRAALVQIQTQLREVGDKINGLEGLH